MTACVFLLPRSCVSFKNKILVASSNRYTSHNRLLNHHVVCCAKSVRQTDTDTNSTVDGVVFRAFHSLRQSNRADGADILCPSVGRSAGTALRHGPKWIGASPQRRTRKEMGTDTDTKDRKRNRKKEHEIEPEYKVVTRNFFSQF